MTKAYLVQTATPAGIDPAVIIKATSYEARKEYAQRNNLGITDVLSRVWGDAVEDETDQVMLALTYLEDGAIATCAERLAAIAARMKAMAEAKKKHVDELVKGEQA